MKKYLNRDGLEEYNSLLPHSSTEIEEYVADWLDAHPEATTTVQDGSITTQKLADGSVTRNKLAADVAHLLGGMMLTANMVGESFLINDAYTIAPLSLTIDGKTTQAEGTPTPNNQIEIVNIEAESLQLNFSPKNVLPESVAYYWTISHGWETSGSNNAKHFQFEPNQPFTVSFDITKSFAYTTQNRLYVTNASYFDLSNKTGHFVLHGVANEDGLGGISINKNFIADADRAPYLINVQIEAGEIATQFSPYFDQITTYIPMRGNILSYLNAIAYDKLTFTYDKNSENGSLYNVDLYKTTGFIDLGNFDWIINNSGGNAEKWATTVSDMRANVTVKNRMCSGYKVADSVGINSVLAADSIAPRATTGTHSLYVKDSQHNSTNTTVEQFKEYVTGIKYLYKLDDVSFRHIDLGTIEIPNFPSNGVIVSIVPSTRMYMEYMRESNIVISDIEQAIADM